jgi:hypothetical protein
MGSYAPREMMNCPLYGQIAYNSSLSNGFKLNLGHNVELFLVEILTATGKDIVEHRMRPANEFPANLILANSAHF